MSMALSLPLLAGLASPVGAALPLTEVAEAHAFEQPLFLTNAGDARLFVVEKGGRIKIVHENEPVSTFLDISSKVSTNSERGLLGLAFHPGYATNGLFYVNYTRADGDIVIAEYQRSGNPDVADDTSERVVLTIEHSSAGNHNGGWIGFKGSGLFISVGDGGNTPNAAQNLESLLGKILKINPLDPDGAGAQSYSIPSSNPFVGRSGRDEIWAYGLRNPWRCSHDPATGNLFCADVGQGKFEEIDRYGTGKGRNFGWPLLEGLHYYNYPGRTSGALCQSNCRTLPILEYRHDVTDEDNCSVTGGYVARRAGATLAGKYTYADLCSGRVWSIPAGYQRGGGAPTLLANTGLTVSSFGVGADGRLYILDYGGRVFRLNQS